MADSPDSPSRPPVDPAQLRGRVLLVEDNPLNQRVARLLLAPTALEVTIAGTSDEAIAALAEGGFDLILMDNQIPGVDGTELSRRIREGTYPAQDAKTAIVAVTANATLEAEQASRDAGMNAFLTKPLRRPELFATLARFLGSASPDA